MLKARFLGTPYVEFGADSAQIALSGRELALFTYLCIARKPTNRLTVADLLWDNQSERQAKTNLRYTLRGLRKAIGDYLFVDGQTIAFNWDLPYWFDVASLTTYLAPTRRAPSAAIEPVILHEVLNLYTGEFLAGFHVQDAPGFEQWMLAQRRHLHDLMIYGLQLATQHHLEQGDYDAGLALNHYFLTLEPWREEVHRQRMYLLAASGQRSAALMQYELCCQILEEELDVAPMDETTSLYKQIKSGLWFIEQNAAQTGYKQRVAVHAFSSSVPPQFYSVPGTAEVAAQELRSHNFDIGAMPPIEHFVGRRKEIAALNQWFDDGDCRLAAILGLGGQGKSTLAAFFVQQQLAKQQAQRDSAQSVPGDSERVEHSQFPVQPNQASASGATSDFTHLIWRSLSQRPSCIEILRDWIHHLTQTPRTGLPTSFDHLISMLFTVLDAHRCLLVLDGVDAVLLHDAAQTREEAVLYEQLFCLFVERQHRSCLLLTSRVRPKILDHRQRRNRQIHYLELEGLTLEESEELLVLYDLEADVSVQLLLNQHYSGNPQLLNQLTDLVYDLFEGDLAKFLAEELYFIDTLGKTLNNQFAQLSPLELQIIDTLHEAQQPLSRQALWELLPSPIRTPVPKEEYYQALRKLWRSYLLRQENDRLKLAALPAAYVTERTCKH